MTDYGMTTGCRGACSLLEQCLVLGGLRQHAAEEVRFMLYVSVSVSE